MPPAEAARAERTTVSLDDFMTGFLAALASRKVSQVSIRGSAFYRAVVDAYDQFEIGASASGVRPTFFLTMNRIHGDSADVREGITRAVQRDLISLDNPVYLDMRLKIGPGDADAYLDSLPGSPDLYRSAADSFLKSYSA